MLAISTSLVMLTTWLLTWAIFKTFFGAFGSTKSTSGISRIKQQFNRDQIIVVEKDKDAEDKSFTQLKISITEFTQKFLRIPIVTNILLTPENLKKTEEKLIWAGRPFGFYADQWISMNIFLVLIVGLWFFFLYTIEYVGMFQIVLIIGILLYMPNWWLNSKIKERNNRFEQELPNIINKLVLATMSGAEILTALNLVVKYTDGILTNEIKKTLSIIRTSAGEISTKQAFWDMAQRCGNPQVTSFCTAIVNSITIKANVSKILKEQTENMKEVRKAHNEEVINRTDTFLMLSAVLGVISILILSIGPGFVQIVQGWG